MSDGTNPLAPAEGASQAPQAVAPRGPSGAAPEKPADRSSTPNRILLIHGYSSNGKEFLPWKNKLVETLIALGRPEEQIAEIAVGNYVSLNNEVTIKDLGEAFDRALRLSPWSGGSKDDSWTFDAIVHSTGMLVVRQWLTSDPFAGTDAHGAADPRSRVRRLKHLVGLAPATFGSPQGKKGRSWLGSLVKGNRDFGPDFLNAGDMVLDGLELASRFTWDLTRRDLVGPQPFYGCDADTPYVTVFIGNQPYTGIAKMVSSPGTDGTVRWAGSALNSRIVELDFCRETRLKDEAGNPTRARMSGWDARLDCPILAVDGRNHGSILSDPDDGVAELICKFLDIASADQHKAWLDTAVASCAAARQPMDDASRYKDEITGKDAGGAGWQQFILHVTDDHGDGVNDYNIQLYIGDDLAQSDDKEFPSVPLIVDAYSGDASYRCFYVRLDQQMLQVGDPTSRKKVWIELIASSGTDYLDYEAYYNLPGEHPEAQTLTALKQIDNPDQAIPNLVKLELTALGTDARLFHPYTTTLVSIVLEREPTPLQKVSGLFQFLPAEESGV